MTKCNCVEEVNAKLVSRNTRLTTAIVFAERGDNPNLMLQTEQIETGRGKLKAAGMFLSCCPFCGVNYDAADEPEETGPLPEGLTATLEYDSLGLAEPKVFFDTEGQQLLFPRTEADLEGIHLNGGCEEITAERVGGWLLAEADYVSVDRTLLAAAVREIREWKVDKGGDDQVVLNLECLLTANS